MPDVEWSGFVETLLKSLIVHEPTARKHWELQARIVVGCHPELRPLFDNRGLLQRIESNYPAASFRPQTPRHIQRPTPVWTEALLKCPLGGCTECVGNFMRRFREIVDEIRGRPARNEPEKNVVAAGMEDADRHAACRYDRSELASMKDLSDENGITVKTLNTRRRRFNNIATQFNSAHIRKGGQTPLVKEINAVRKDTRGGQLYRRAEFPAELLQKSCGPIYDIVQVIDERNGQSSTD